MIIMLQIYIIVYWVMVVQFRWMGILFHNFQFLFKLILIIIFSIHKFIYNNNIDVTNSELKNIFKRLDIDKDNRITFYEFKRLFNNEITNDYKNQRENNQINNKKLINSDKFSSDSFYNNYNNSLKNLKEINKELNSGNLNSFHKEKEKNSNNKYNISYEEENFIYFLKELIEIENCLEKAKIDLTYKSDFNAEDAFRNFEIDGRGYITELDLNYGLNEFDVFAPKEEVNLLLKRYDINNQGFLR